MVNGYVNRLIEIGKVVDMRLFMILCVEKDVPASVLYEEFFQRNENASEVLRFVLNLVEGQLALDNYSRGSGSMIVSVDEFFANEVSVVLWKRVNACVFVTVLSTEENTLAAEEMLHNLVSWLESRFRSEHMHWGAAAAKELLQKPEEVAAVLRELAPHGNILFLSDPLIKQLKKDVDFGVLKKV